MEIDAKQAKYIAEKEPAGSKRWKAGHHAKFLQINSLWGVKFYQSLEKREHSWNLQNIAERVGVGLPVGDWIDCRLPRDKSDSTRPDCPSGTTEPLYWLKAGQNLVGRFDQPAVSMGSDTIDDCPVRYGYLTMVADTKKYRRPEDIKNLGEKLEELGFHDSDGNRSANSRECGYFRGKLVPIDFEGMWLFRVMSMPAWFLRSFPKSGQSSRRVRLYPETTKAIGKALDWRYTPDKEC
tara:strand:- start:236 stop:946 length:711 start_codon:yes stop_codon:yes gene_type:complete